MFQEKNAMKARARSFERLPSPKPPSPKLPSPKLRSPRAGGAGYDSVQYPPWVAKQQRSKFCRGAGYFVHQVMNIVLLAGRQEAPPERRKLRPRNASGDSAARLVVGTKGLQLANPSREGRADSRRRPPSWNEASRLKERLQQYHSSKQSPHSPRSPKSKLDSMPDKLGRKRVGSVTDKSPRPPGRDETAQWAMSASSVPAKSSRVFFSDGPLGFRVLHTDANQCVTVDDDQEPQVYHARVVINDKLGEGQAASLGVMDGVLLKSIGGRSMQGVKAARVVQFLKSATSRPRPLCLGFLELERLPSALAAAGEEGVICPSCRTMFSSPAELLEHVPTCRAVDEPACRPVETQRKVVTPSKEGFICPSCRRVFKSSQMLLAHSKQCNPSAAVAAVRQRNIRNREQFVEARKEATKELHRARESRASPARSKLGPAQQQQYRSSLRTQPAQNPRHQQHRPRSSSDHTASYHQDPSPSIPATTSRRYSTTSTLPRTDTRSPRTRQRKQTNEWKKCWDDASQAYYYVHRTTHESRWENPNEQTTAASTADSEWVSYWDNDQGGYYYYNTRTGEVTSTMPDLLPCLIMYASMRTRIFAYVHVFAVIGFVWAQG